MTWISVCRISVRQSIKVFLVSGSVKPASVAVKTKGDTLDALTSLFGKYTTVKSIIIRYDNDTLYNFFFFFKDKIKNNCLNYIPTCLLLFI